MIGQMKLTMIFLVLGILTLIMIGACSSSKSPIEPAMDEDQNILQDLPEALVAQGENRAILAAYDVVIDTEAETFAITPFDRSSQYHFPLTNLYPDVLQITEYGFTPNLWADIKLQHPLPGNGIDGFDPRVIAILPANAGVRFIYPLMGVGGNNAVVLEPDGYTRLFDELGGSISGNVNPFKAYFKDQPYRRWSSTIATEDTQRWQMNLNGFGGPIQFKFVVDVSTNYPDPPTPVTDNAPEPAYVALFMDQAMTSSGGSAEIIVRLLDWHDPYEIECKVECPELFNGTIQLFYYGTVGNDVHRFKGTISNELLAPEGEYNILIAACDVLSDPDIYMYYEAVAHVNDELAFDPVYVTPPWLDICPQDVFVEGNYAYFNSAIYNIANPVNPIWVNRSPWYGDEIHVSDGYSYLVSGNRFVINDIDPPESAHKVRYIDFQFSHARGLDVSGGYAYVTTTNREPIPIDVLDIIDIDPPESANIVKMVRSEGCHIDGVSVSDGYAYVADNGLGLQVIDIDPPETACIVKTVYTPVGRIHALNGYAYATCGAGLCIIDIESPEEAYILKTVDISEGAREVHVSDGYAYVGDCESGLQIIDIDPPESAYIVKNADILDDATGIHVSDGYAYVAEDSFGFQIIDIEPPESAFIAKTVYTSSKAEGVHVSGDYAYVAAHEVGLSIINTASPESATCVTAVDTPGLAYEVRVSGNYAYVADSESGLQIIDVNSPELAYIVKSVDTPGDAYGVYISDDYAYIADRESGLQIIDINPPESAYIVKTVDTPGDAKGIYVSDDYAYIADYESGLQIIDINPPESAYIVKTVDTPGNAKGIYVSGVYAYVGDGSTGLEIIDIDPPESAHIVKTVVTPGYANLVGISGGYAFIAEDYSIRIIDINPPESAYVIKTINNISPNIKEVNVVGGYAFIAGQYSGLDIYKLW